MDELRVAESIEDYLHSVFFRTVAKGHLPRPWVTLSWAQTSDGSIAQTSGVPAAISGAESLSITHALRAHHSAILVGINTVIADDPRLTTRLVAGASPRPVVLDSHLRCPPSARIFSEARRDHRPGPVVVTTEDALRHNAATATALSDAGGSVVSVASAPQGGLALTDALEALCDLELDSVMVEGGGLVLRSFLSTTTVDAMAVTIAPHVLDGYRPFPWELVERCCGLADRQRFRVGSDEVLFSVSHREAK